MGFTLKDVEPGFLSISEGRMSLLQANVLQDLQESIDMNVQVRPAGCDTRLRSDNRWHASYCSIPEVVIE